MIVEPLSLYFGVGARWVYLQRAPVGAPVHGKGYILDVVTLFFQDLERFQFRVTQQATGPLRAFERHLKSLEPGSSLSEADVAQLQRALAPVTAALEAEAAATTTVAFAEKRYDLDLLLRKPQRLFASGVYAGLPALAQEDFHQAGCCLAFDLPTAAAFHTMRGTEAVLRQLHECFIRRGRRRQATWGDIIVALRAKRTRRPPADLLDHLDSMRKHFRNPTQHPDKVYDIDEAQDLFGTAVAAVNMMRRAIVDERGRQARGA